MIMIMMAFIQLILMLTFSIFTHQIKQHSIFSEEVMVSFDVKSLFTTIPLNLSLTITKVRLQRDQNLAERTNLSVDNILRLSDFVLNHNYFKYDGDHYKQILVVRWVLPLVLF